MSDLDLMEYLIGVGDLSAADAKKMVLLRAARDRAKADRRSAIAAAMKAYQIAIGDLSCPHPINDDCWSTGCKVCGVRYESANGYTG